MDAYPKASVNFLCVVLTLGILKADTPNVATQVAAMPEGAKIELRLKTKETLRGARGPVSDATDRQIAFDDVLSVKLYKSHTTRNVLIIVAIGVVVTVGIIAAVALRCAPLGCNTKL